MTETQGVIAGILLFFALYLYIFWPQNVSEAGISNKDQLIEPPLKTN
jgi:hypothetical protein